MKIKSILLIAVLCLPALRLQGYERSGLIDSDTAMVIRVSNGTAVINAIKNTPLGKLWNSPRMKPFLNNQSLEDALIRSIFSEQYNSKGKDLEKIIHLNHQILSLFKGEVVVGFEKDGSYYALVETNETDYKTILELTKESNKLTSDTHVMKNHMFQGVELVQEIITGDDGVKNEWTAFYRDTFISSNTRPWLEKCIVRLKKEPPSAPSGPPSLKVHLPNGFIHRLMEPEKKQENSNSTAKLFNALGVDEVEKVSFEWIIPPSRSILNVRIQRAPDKTTGKGFWKLLTNDPLPRRHYLQYVPDDIMSYQVFRLDLPAFWEELPAIFAAMGPQAATQFQMGLKSISGMLQVDISRDFIGNLDTILTYYSRLDGITDTTLYIWQLRDSRAMEKTLGKIFTENAWLPMMLKDNFQRLDLGEYNIYSIKLPQFQMPKEGKENTPTVEYINYGFTVIDGDFVFGRINMIRSYIHGTADKSGGRKFYRSPLYTEMNRHVPDDAVGYGFVDIAPFIESGLNLFKSIKPKSRPKQQTASDTPQAIDPLNRYFENLRFDRLPPLEFLRSFFTPWTNYIQFNGNQYIIKWEMKNSKK